MNLEKGKDFFQNLDNLRIVSIACLVLLVMAAGVISITNTEQQPVRPADRANHFEEISQASGEMINYLGVDVEVLENDVLNVTYVLQITSAGVRYFRGIAPGVTMGHTYADGSEQNYTITDLTALKDSEPEHFELKDHSKQVKRLYVFNPDKNVEKGLHSYQISYKVEGAVVQMENHKQILWHALHPIWSLPVKSMALQVRFPRTVHLNSVEAIPFSQGPDGTREKGEYRFESEDNGIVMWPKGGSSKPLSSFFATLKWSQSAS